MTNDPKCVEDKDLDPEKRYIAFLSGDDAVPNIMTVGEDDISVNALNFALTTSIVKATPRWGQRAFSAMFDWK